MDGQVRKSPLCQYFGICAGCSEDLTLKPPPIWEEVLTFFKSIAIPQFYQGSPVHWRHRAKMAVRGSSENPLIGLFKVHSHEVYPIPECLVHHPHLNQAFECVRLWMLNHGIIPYDENTGKGELRYLQGVVQRKSGRVQLSLIINSVEEEGENALKWRLLFLQLANEHPNLWHSIWVNYNNQRHNVIFGDKWSHIWGEKDLWEQFGEVEVCYGPASFGQANLPLFERMLVKIKELVLPQACVVEYYAGVGVIGLYLADKGRWIRCSEMNPYAENYFNQSCSRLSQEITKKLTFSSRSTQQALSLMDEATTVIVDPPRKGLDPSFISYLKKTSTITQLLYISCGWEGFKRDCQKLMNEGWKIINLEGYHFFPGTNHVELLANFERT
jgi:23S rRNA (uracil1939-C5)-methyltransferase